MGYYEIKDALERKTKAELLQVLSNLINSNPSLVSSIKLTNK